jgi:hypothetical protein
MRWLLKFRLRSSGLRPLTEVKRAIHAGQEPFIARRYVGSRFHHQAAPNTATIINDSLLQWFAECLGSR